MKMQGDEGSEEVVMIRDRAVSGVEEAASKGARLAEEASISISLSGTRRAARRSRTAETSMGTH